jgi:hypothetical protein
MSIPRPNGWGAIDRVTIPCGKCAICCQKKRAHWSFRLNQELKIAKSALFVTLTYDDENMPENNELSKMDVQLFLKRLRALSQNPIRYFITGEFGSKNNRPHYHALIFNLDVNNTESAILTTWKKGFIYIGTVTPKSIYYCAKYVMKDSGQKSFAMMSLKPGIGKNYVDRLTKYHNENQVHYGVEDFGQKVSLPRYYRDKIFSGLDIVKNTNKIRKEADVRINELEKTIPNYFGSELQKKQQKVNSIFNRLKNKNVL